MSVKRMSPRSRNRVRAGASAVAFVLLGAVPIAWMTDIDLRSHGASIVRDDHPAGAHEGEPVGIRLAAHNTP
jgi:hypothetical protein